MKSLVELNEGEFGFIVDYTAIEEIESFFEMGILPGEKIVVKDNKQGSEWISIQLNRHIISIRKNKAKTIITNYISFDICLN